MRAPVYTGNVCKLLGLVRAMVKPSLTLLCLLVLTGAAHATPKADLVLVKKSERKLLLVRDGEPIKTFHISLGPRPRGHKQYSGDERTPEGSYLLDYKKDPSRFYKAIHISYPNRNDLENARRLGLDPGGNIMIHGYPVDGSESVDVARNFNWTNGCIAVTNEEMDEIWAMVEPGTPIQIHP